MWGYEEPNALNYKVGPWESCTGTLDNETEACNCQSVIEKENCDALAQYRLDEIFRGEMVGPAAAKKGKGKGSKGGAIPKKGKKGRGAPRE